MIRNNRPRPSARWNPNGALLSPLFLISLLLLAFNDHLFKGAGVLPTWFTGKLSDVTGLVVATVVLAVIFRVRGPLGLLLAQLASGLFLIALQLSPEFTSAWMGLLNLIGIPSTNTADITDLFALIILWPAFFALSAAMSSAQELAFSRFLQKAAQALSLCVASLFLMATSQAECQNYDETTLEASADTAPFYPGQMTVEEVLERYAGSHEYTLNYEPNECEPGAYASQTTVILDIGRDISNIVHHTYNVDESMDTSKCWSRVDGTEITFDTSIRVSTLDGRIDYSTRATFRQAPTYRGSDMSAEDWDALPASERNKAIALMSFYDDDDPTLKNHLSEAFDMNTPAVWGASFHIEMGPTSQSGTIGLEVSKESGAVEKCYRGRWASEP